MEPAIKTEPYKFIYALVFAAATTASSIYTDMTWLTIVLAALTAVGVYFVPNPPKPDSPSNPNPGGPTVGDSFS